MRARIDYSSGSRGTLGAHAVARAHARATDLELPDFRERDFQSCDQVLLDLRDHCERQQGRDGETCVLAEAAEPCQPPRVGRRSQRRPETRGRGNDALASKIFSVNAKLILSLSDDTFA